MGCLNASVISAQVAETSRTLVKTVAARVVQGVVLVTLIVEDALVTAPELEVVRGHGSCLFCLPDKPDDA